MKRILALLLAVMMTLSLAACGNDTPPANSDGSNETPPTVETDTGASGDNSNEKDDKDTPDDTAPVGFLSEVNEKYEAIRNSAHKEERAMGMDKSWFTADQLKFIEETIGTSEDGVRAVLYDANPMENVRDIEVIEWDTENNAFASHVRYQFYNSDGVYANVSSPERSKATFLEDYPDMWAIKIDASAYYDSQTYLQPYNDFETALRNYLDICVSYVFI